MYEYANFVKIKFIEFVLKSTNRTKHVQLAVPSLTTVNILYTFIEFVLKHMEHTSYFHFSPVIKLVLHGTDDQKEIICKEKADLADYFQPTSPG